MVYPPDSHVWQQIIDDISEGKSLSSSLRAEGMP